MAQEITSYTNPIGIHAAVNYLQDRLSVLEVVPVVGTPYPLINRMYGLVEQAHVTNEDGKKTMVQNMPIGWDGEHFRAAPNDQYAVSLMFSYEDMELVNGRRVRYKIGIIGWVQEKLIDNLSRGSVTEHVVNQILNRLNFNSQKRDLAPVYIDHWQTSQKINNTVWSGFKEDSFLRDQDRKMSFKITTSVLHDSVCDTTNQYIQSNGLSC